MISFDTNILVYATDPCALEKRSVARNLFARGVRSANAVLLLQTLGEFSHVALRKKAMPADEVRPLIGAWHSLCRSMRPRSPTLSRRSRQSAITACHSGMQCCGRAHAASGCVIF